jgi:hypothetical protein
MENAMISHLTKGPIERQRKIDLSKYISPDDVVLPRREQLRIVAERILDDLRSSQRRTFPDFMKAEVGSSWCVHAKRTPSIVRRYGKDVVCLTQKEYLDLNTKWENEE